ncbi:nuclear transport factor 2 family protein [Nocardia sp. NPDC051900]|uniref:nuclear transport factor 2 family protein n=1 Tax=Nocardia sp. NPDC051900 TaxID=3364326 RepID=UPI0037A5D531
MSTAADTTAVTNLIMKYAELVDAGDFAGVGALFADGVFVGSGTTIRGREGVEKMQPVAAGRYHDRFERVDGQWRFVERRVHIHLTGDLSRYLRA